MGMRLYLIQKRNWTRRNRKGNNYASEYTDGIFVKVAVGLHSEKIPC